MWYSNDTFHYVLKVEFVTFVSLKVPSGVWWGKDRAQEVWPAPKMGLRPLLPFCVSDPARSLQQNLLYPTLHGV